MTKTRQDNDVIDCTGAVYAKFWTELSWSVRYDVVYHENQTNRTNPLYAKNKIELSWSIQ